MTRVDDHGHYPHPRRRYVDRNPIPLEDEPAAANIRSAKSAAVPGASGAAPPGLLLAPLPEDLRRLFATLRSKLAMSGMGRALVCANLEGLTGDHLRTLSAAQTHNLVDELASLIDVARKGQ